MSNIDLEICCKNHPNVTLDAEWDRIRTGGIIITPCEQCADEAVHDAKDVEAAQEKGYDEGYAQGVKDTEGKYNGAKPA